MSTISELMESEYAISFEFRSHGEVERRGGYFRFANEHHVYPSVYRFPVRKNSEEVNEKFLGIF